MSRSRAQQLDKCDLPAATTTAAAAPTQQGVGTLWARASRSTVTPCGTTVFPWVTAGGAPGRVAFMFARHRDDGNPNSGTFKARWNIYVNSLD